VTLDAQTLVEIACLRDPTGVLSIYVDADPQRTPGDQPGWAVAVRTQLRAVERNVRTEGPRDRWLAFAARLAELEAELSRLLDPRGPGRGRALFVAVSQGEVRRISVQAPFPDRVVLADSAYTRPLVAAFCQGRPAGVALVSRAGIDVLEWRFGDLEELAHFSFSADTSGWREMKGPAPANPALAQQSAPQQDRYKRRLDERYAAFARSAGKRLARLATARDWQQIVLFGDPRLLGRLQSQGLDSDGHALLLRQQQIEQLGRNALERTVARELAQHRRQRDLMLAEQVRAEALAGGAVALGLDETARALDEARVSHLLFDTQRDYPGARAPDGRVVATGTIAGVPAVALQHESDLAELMIERALATSAKVTALEGRAARVLDGCGGVAASLRW
jgi:hypothetical protein